MILDDYFNEFEPEDRKKILESMQPDDTDDLSLDQIRTLFAHRYKVNRKGEYADQFLGAMMDLRPIGNPRQPMSKNLAAREMRRRTHILCLDRAETFSADLLYREMYQMVYLYMSLCMDDHHYGSVLFDFGRLSDTKIVTKIQNELDQMAQAIDSYANETNDYSLLVRAIRDCMSDKLRVPEASDAKGKNKNKKEKTKKIDER